MRLTAVEIDAIKKSINIYDPTARVYLFGSRVDDTKKGGDIDILLESNSITDDDKWKIVGEICDKIGERKIDVVVVSDENQRAFVKIIREKAIRL